MLQSAGGMAALTPASPPGANTPIPVPPRVYADGRPGAKYRLAARDQGAVFRHGEAPERCDYLGARDVWVWRAGKIYYMHYDGAGPNGWLCCLATSQDLVHWKGHGPVLDFGAPGTHDSKSASYGVTYFDGKRWHLFYLGTEHVTPAPNLVPNVPYFTMKAEADSPAGPWRKRYDITPFLPQRGSYYEDTAFPGHIIKAGPEYRMYFSAAKWAATGTAKRLKRTLGIARTADLDASWRLDPASALPQDEQVESASLYFEPANNTWFLFTNHIGFDGRREYTDAVWMYWSRDGSRWNPEDKAVVLDGTNCIWSRECVGSPCVLRLGERLALFYDGPGGDSKSHMNRDIGMAWLNLPLQTPPA